jgi:hypothetical protein
MREAVGMRSRNGAHYTLIVPTRQEVEKIFLLCLERDNRLNACWIHRRPNDLELPNDCVIHSMRHTFSSKSMCPCSSTVRAADS